MTGVKSEKNHSKSEEICLYWLIVLLELYFGGHIALGTHAIAAQTILCSLNLACETKISYLKIIVIVDQDIF